ncbi:nucleotide pyrophosphohydrolase [Gemmatimonadota bacterium]
MALELQELKTRLREFAEERDWNQFHSPKNLAMALIVEAAELVEHFQWVSEEDSQNLSDSTLLKVAEEIADIQIYLVRLADKLGIDILAAAEAKLKENCLKYPASQVKGSSRKYTHYGGDDSSP